MICKSMFLTDCTCVFVAKAAKYGALQGFLGGAGAGYRGTYSEVLIDDVVTLSAFKWCFFLHSQVGLEDARANTAGGGSRETF